MAEVVIVVSQLGCRLFRLLTFCSLAAVMIGCGVVSSDEVARLRSPTGRLEAVVIETNGGATASFGYKVYIVPAGSGTWRGKEVASLYGAVRNENAYGVNIRWITGDSLAIEYLQARQQHLAMAVAEVTGERVKIALREGISDPNAPAGGMLYNLQRLSGNRGN